MWLLIINLLQLYNIKANSTKLCTSKLREKNAPVKYLRIKKPRHPQLPILELILGSIVHNTHRKSLRCTRKARNFKLWRWRCVNGTAVLCLLNALLSSSLVMYTNIINDLQEFHLSIAVKGYQWVSSLLRCSRRYTYLIAQQCKKKQTTT